MLDVIQREIENDPFFCDDAFELPCLIFGNVAVAIQPARGYNIDPKSSYHDPALVPPHGYFAFYFWLRHVFGAHAVIHNGKHGNLAEQSRSLATATQPRAGASAPAAPRTGLDLAKAAACTACHGVNERIVGPGFREIATKYTGDAKAESHLVAKVKGGGAGAWGAIPMPAQAQLPDAEVRSLVQWILAGAK